MHAGVAPVPVSSGRTDRYRLSRGGNRQLNAALHRIAITQLRLSGPGQSYYRRRRAQGDATGEAVRALKRRIARASTSTSSRPNNHPSQPQLPLDRGAT
jgi:transposase